MGPPPWESEITGARRVMFALYERGDCCKSRRGLELALVLLANDTRGLLRKLANSGKWNGRMVPDLNVINTWYICRACWPSDA